MKYSFADWLIGHWYNPKSPLYLLAPVSWPFYSIAKIRRWLYVCGLRKRNRVRVPVIVVGNITVGGTGKTPLVIGLVQFLRANGWNPGIVSRGYGGTTIDQPQWVDKNSEPDQVGDEPVLMATRTECPIAVGANRVAAANMILDQSDCNLIVSDDGLQHYALHRDIEISVIDSQRRYGNGYCLPVGPLREPLSRLESVDLVVCNGGKRAGACSMLLRGDVALNLLDPNRKMSLNQFRSTDCHAVAGIGNPQRFFEHLRSFGLRCNEHRFPDHYEFDITDLQFTESSPVLMTEKDAVKCRSFAQENYWYVPVDAQLDDQFFEKLTNLLKRYKDG